MKIIFTLAALCIAISSLAQIEKGRNFFTGQIGGDVIDQHTVIVDSIANTTNTMLTHSKSINGSITYGYLFADTWAVGVRGTYISSKNNYSTTTSTGNGYGGSIYVRKYFPVVDRLYLHLDGGLMYSQSTAKNEDHSIHYRAGSTSKISSIYVSPGITYFVGKHFALTATFGSLNYSQTKQKDTSPTYYSSSKQTAGTLSLGINSIGFGVSVYF